MDTALYRTRISLGRSGRSGCVRLQAKADTLRAEITEMEQTAAGLTGKTWGLTLMQWDNERGIILPRGVKVDRTGPLKDGREAIVIKP